MKFSLVGSGFVSGVLQKQIGACSVFGRDSIHNMTYLDHDVIIVSAPTGKRLQVEDSPNKDLEDCKTIVKQLESTRFKTLIHISTVDVFRNSQYGKNRQWLEQALMKFSSLTIRLPSLIHHTISKNILYDLSHKQWLEKISLQSTIQWYPLDDLFDDIKKTIELEIKENNLVSRPVTNQQIVENLEPDLLETLSTNQCPSVHYDMKSCNNDYWVNDETIWSSFRQCYSQMKKSASN